MKHQNSSARYAALALFVITILAGACSKPAQEESAADSSSQAAVLATMKRATTFMREQVATNGGYVWACLLYTSDAADEYQRV